MNNLEKAQIALNKKRAEGLVKHLTPFEKLQRKPGRSTAINAKCWDCQGRDADPAVNWRIGNCECEDCPLWDFRPYQKLLNQKPPKAFDLDG